MKNIFLIIFFCCSALLTFSCNHEAASIDKLPEVSFSNDVLPIFQTGCAISGCHDETSAKEDEVYTNYQNISRAVVAGNPKDSKIYKAITNYYQIMPPQKALPVEERTKIRIWILQGASNN